MQLPADIRKTIDEIISEIPISDIKHAAISISNRYRRIDENKKNLGILSDEEAVSYIATRLPATFCAASKAIEYISNIMDDFQPAKILDIGAGPATATLAALNYWASIKSVSLIEPNIYLQARGEKLLQQSYPLIKAKWDISQIGNKEISKNKYDFVVSGYVLNEIMQEQGINALTDTIKKMWDASSNTLLIIEPGTPAGQDVILHARQVLIDEGANLIAPCPHSKTCPVSSSYNSAEKWCHFPVRVDRSRTHKNIKQDAVLGYEDEKFSYLAVTKEEIQAPKYRVMGRPRGKKVIQTEVCVEDGNYQSLKIAKVSKDYKTFRKASWGDEIK